MALARHDLRKTYAGTPGGALLWSVLTPFVPILLFSALFSLGLRLPLGGAPYVLGFAAAYIPWVLIASSITGAAGSIVDHRQFVKRVVFPVQIIPAEAVIVHSIAHLVLVAVLIAACGIAGELRAQWLPLLVYFYGCAAVFSFGTGLLLASLTTLVRNTRQVLPSMLNVWFWITPVVWATSQLPPLGRTLLVFNPVAYVVSGYRFVVMPTHFPPPSILATTVFWLMTITILGVSTFVFRRLRPHFWECL